MKTEQNETAKETKKKMTVRRVLRMLAVLCIIFVFCPAFMVSCAGQSMGVTVITAVTGVKYDGTSLVSPHLEMLVCLIIPVLILIWLAGRKRSEHKQAVSIAAASAVDIAIWLLFRSTVRTTAENFSCGFRTTGWFTLNILSLAAIAALAALVIAKKLSLDQDVRQLASALKGSPDRLAELTGQGLSLARTAAGSQMPDREPVSYCSACGNPILPGARFCDKCGTPVPEQGETDGTVTGSAPGTAAGQADWNVTGNMPDTAAGETDVNMTGSMPDEAGTANEEETPDGPAFGKEV